MDSPIVFLIFNRPDTTRLVFEAIREAKPRVLLVVADGPRPGRPEDKLKCSAVRQIIDQGIDWECEVHFKYSDSNLGCGKSVSDGLDWAFKRVDEAIILEDDCLPSLDFFRFCDEMLARFRDDQRVMHIGGTNLSPIKTRTTDSYYFSRFPMIWGWATWRRAWRKHELRLPQWPDLKKTGWLRDIVQKKSSVRYWEGAFDSAVDWTVDTWDSQWFFAVWKEEAFAVVPNSNLVSNIGFGKNATHTNNSKSPWANRSMEKISRPLVHPQMMTQNIKADLFLESNLFRAASFFSVIRAFISRCIRFFIPAWRRNRF